jgi:hypothetical protein
MGDTMSWKEIIKVEEPENYHWSEAFSSSGFGDGEHANLTYVVINYIQSLGDYQVSWIRPHAAGKSIWIQSIVKHLLERPVEEGQYENIFPADATENEAMKDAAGIIQENDRELYDKLEEKFRDGVTNPEPSIDDDPWDDFS